MKILLIFIFVLPLINTFSQTDDLRNQKFSRHYYIKKQVFESMPNDNNEIIFLGNSITAGVGWAELFNNIRIKNRGISGDVTAGILFRLEEVTESKPSKIFLMIGVNDLSKGLSVDSILQNYDKILINILNNTPNTKIFIQSVLPVNDEFDYFENHTNKGDSILILNRGLEILTEKYKQTYIDLFSSFVNDEGKLIPEYTLDGLHLNGNGYTAWKKLIEKYVN